MGQQGEVGTERNPKEQILDAAERLFAERGIAETSVRDITMAAGANVAAVNYYFGTKEALLREIVTRRLAALNSESFRLLSACQAAEAGPTVETLLTALVDPSIDLCFAHPYFALLASRLRLDADQSHWENYRAQRRELIRSFRAAFAIVLPAFSEEEITTRLRYVTGGVQHLWAHCPLGPEKSAEGILRSFLAFYAAGLRAPAPDR